MKKRMRRAIAFLIALLVLSLSLFPPLMTVAETLRAPNFVTIETASATTFIVRWDNSVPGATGYTLQRSVDGGSFLSVLQTDTSYNQYTDTVVNGKMYQYRVYARSATQNGPIAYSIEIPMLQPVSLHAVSTGSDKMLLTWTLPFNDQYPLTGFKTILERRLVGSDWKSVATVENGVLQYLDTGLLEGRLYEYRARMDTGIGGVALFYPSSGSVSGYVMLQTPTDYTASLNASGHAILTWADVSEYNTGTLVERSVDGGAYTQVANVNAGINTWTDTTLVNGKIYSYRIRHNSTSTANFSPYTPEARLALLSPTALVIETTYDKQVDLVWTYPTADPIILGEAVTQIERRTAGESTWTLVHTAETGILAWRDQTVKPDTVYYYRIRAQYGSGTLSPWHPSASGLYAKTVTLLDISFTGYALTTEMIRLDWDATRLNGRRVMIERTDSAGEFAHLATITNEGFYLDTGLTAGSTQQYRFRLITASGAVSDYSPTLTVLQEAVPTPLSITVSPVGEGLAGLNWVYPYETESGFEIWRKTDGSWEKIGETPRNTLNWQDSSVPLSGAVTWRVRAIRGSTAFSAFVTSAPLQQDAPLLPSSFVVRSAGGYTTLLWSMALPTGATYQLQTRNGINDDWKTFTVIAAGSRSATTMNSGVGAFDIRILALRDGLYASSPIYHFWNALPESPDSLSVPMIGSSRVVLTWIDRTEKEDQYKVYRTNNGVLQEIAQLPANTTHYIDTAPMPGQSVRYEVVAINATGASTADTITVAVPLAPAYRDMGTSAWALDAVNTLTRLGVLSGKRAGLYYPKAAVTRAEFLKMLMSTLDIYPKDDRAPFLLDVREGLWYTNWVHTAVRLGIIIPDSAGRFYPEIAATRADMVVMAARAAAIANKQLSTGSLTLLEDYPDGGNVPASAQGAFAVMVGEGIILGKDGLLAPYATATRAEAAVILNRLRVK